MDGVSNVPRRPPPPPPIDSSNSLSSLRRGNDDRRQSTDDEEEGRPLHRGGGGGGGGDFVDSPPGSPPSFAEALRGSSPTGLYWEGSGRQPIPQDASDMEDDDDDRGEISPPLYSPSSPSRGPVAGLGERLAAFVGGYRDHVAREPAPGQPRTTLFDHEQQTREQQREEEENHQPHHQTPPPPFEDEPEEEEEEEDEEVPRQPPIIIITGATTGLGLALFKHFASKPKSGPDVPYDVIGIDKTPWRVPGTGFRWQTPVGQSGMFTQLDLTARPTRLESWAQTFLYSKPMATKRRRRGRVVKVRYPRPVSLVVHCAASSARGLVEIEEPKEDGQKMNKKKKQPQPPILDVTEEELESFEAMDADTMRRTFDGNVVATLQLVQMVTPHLQLEASTRDEELGALIGGGSSSTTSGSSVGAAEDSESDDEDAETLIGDVKPAANNLDWLEALKTQGSRASLTITTPPPKLPKKEKPLPSAPRDGIPAPRVVIMGSRMGSLASNKRGGGYAFRASQAALNAVVRSLSIDVPEVCFACVYPGEFAVPEKKKPARPPIPKSPVATTGPLLVKMAGEEDQKSSNSGATAVNSEKSIITKKTKKSKEEVKITVEDSVKGLLPMFERLGEGKLRTGCFVDRFGEPIPW